MEAIALAAAEGEHVRIMAALPSGSDRSPEEDSYSESSSFVKTCLDLRHKAIGEGKS
jgi:hypothetical protein